MPSEGRRDARTTRDSDATGTGSRPQAKGKSTNGTLDGWVEPSLAAKPSFEDHGGAPYGVLEHMQPLGEPPSTRVRARVKGDGARKSMAGKGAAGLGLDAQDTPEGTPGPQYSSQATDALPPLPPIAMDDEEDEDYAPGKKSKKKERAAKPRAAKRQSESAGPSNETPPPGKGRGKGKKAADKAAAEAAQIAREDAAWETAKESLLVDNVNQNTVYDARKLRIVVNEAKRRATAVGKPAMGEAVEEVYQQSLSNTRLTWLLEAVLLQTANKEDMDEFHDYVRKAKRKLKEAEQKASESANGKQPLPVRTPAKEEQISRVKEEAPAIPSTEKSELPRPKFSIKVKSPPKPTAHSRPTQSEPMSSSPAKQQSADLDDDASELSELTELSEGEEMDRDDDVGSHTAPPGRSSRVNGVKIKDQAAERGSLGVQSNNLKRSSADAEIHETEQDRVLSAKKLKLSGSVQRDYDWQESHVRGSLARGSRGAGTKNGGVVPPKITLHPGGAGNAGARGSRAVSTDAESPLSSPALSSRRSTPHVWKGPPKQPGKRAKTKTSPEKKHQHSYGSLTGAGGAGRDSPIGDDDNEELSENNDFCSSCGGSGFLLCCDGCDRAFHFTCLDPPIKEEASELNEPWYCFICVAKRPASIEQPERPAQGLFAPLLTSLNKSNPKTFQLPESVRSYFEGVATAKNGEFTEAVKPKTRRGGLDEKPDDFKLKDNKGNSVLCYACNKSSLGKRPIIGCDYCSQCWHLDCVDPPLANPPNRDHLGFKTGDWMCPLHADHELRQVETRLLKPARRVHIRKPRQAKTMQTALQRGLQNNGVIEIADDESDDSDSEFYEDDREPAIVYKMPAQGIKLDFIDKVKQTRVQDSQIERLSKRIKLDNAMNAPSALSQANFTRRSIREQQTALSLAQFANANPDLDLGGDRVENLVGALIAEAPSDVVDTIAAAEGRKGFQPNGIKKSPSPPSSQHTESLSSEERRELEMLQELIKRKLEGGKP